MTRDFAMPDLGEGLTESELVAWHVAVGELVELNQPIAEVETAKAIVQLPSPYAGVVSELYVEPGTVVEVGARLVAFDLDAPEGTAGETAKPERNSVLVGYGPPVDSDGTPKRKRPSTGSGTVVPVPVAAPAPVAEPSPVAELVEAPATASGRVRTTPPVRKLAADLGIDLASVVASGADGLVTRADVLAASSHAPEVSTTPSREIAATRTVGPRETRIPIKGVRKATADAMVLSKFTAPHASEYLTIDVTATMELVAALRIKTKQHVTVLSLVSKALLIAAARHPAINSRWDEANQEIVQFAYVNLGIAVATPRGLLVPNIPDAQELSLGDLTTALSELVSTAREGRTAPSAFSGGTISITNIGVFGIDSGTPILNPGEAAIIAMGAIRKMPWEFHGDIALRDVMTLSMSFDHRLVDGEQASLFLSDLGQILSNPGMVLTMV